MFNWLKPLRATQNVYLFGSLQHTQTLTLVTQWYNQLHVTILDVELGLVKEEMDGVRQQLDPALRELTWAQDDLWDYIQSMRDLVKVPKLNYLLAALSSLCQYLCIPVFNDNIFICCQYSRKGTGKK